MKFYQWQIDEVNKLLASRTDEELYEIFIDVFDIIKEKVNQIRERPKAVYTNRSPYGIADELHRN